MDERQSRLACGLATVLLVLLCGCGRESAESGRRAAADGAQREFVREGALDLLARAPDSAARREWIHAFESDTSCKVRLRTAATSAELLVLASQSDSDLVLAGGDLASTLVSAGRAQVLEERRIPALAAIHPRLRDLPGAIADGRRYGVPWQWQPNVLAYDTRAFPAPPASWKELLEPVASDAAGARALGAGEPIAIADAALYLAATQPALRIADPYALDERQYAAVLALLRRQKVSLRGYASDLETQAEAFGNGVTVAVATPAGVRALQARQLPVAWVAPVEGASAQVEVAMLLAGARHPNCAYAWMQWSLSPAPQALLAAEAGALPVLPAACKLEPLASADACGRDGMALLPTVHFWRVPEARCGRSRCVPYSRWTRDYLALVGE